MTLLMVYGLGVGAMIVLSAFLLGHEEIENRMGAVLLGGFIWPVTLMLFLGLWLRGLLDLREQEKREAEERAKRLAKFRGEE